MATVTNYPIDLPILVIEAQIFVAVNKFQFLPNKLIPSGYCWVDTLTYQLIIPHTEVKQIRS